MPPDADPPSFANVTSPSTNASSVTHRVVTYWATFHEGANGNGPYVPLRPVVQNNSGITDLLLFVCDVHNTAPYLTVGGKAPDNTTWLPAQFWDDVHYLQANNVNVLASFGGYESNMFILLEQDFDFYYPLIRDFLKTYGLSGIDLDIEPSTNSLTSYATGQSILRLLFAINADFGSDFLVSMAPIADDLTGQYNPQFYSGFNYNLMDELAVDENGNHIITWFNGQFYNGYGYCNQTNTYDQAVMYGGWDPSRVVFLVAADAGDAFGWCPLDIVEHTAAYLIANYTNLGGIGGYAYLAAGSSDNLTSIEYYQHLAAAIGNTPSP